MTALAYDATLELVGPDPAAGGRRRRAVALRLPRSHQRRRDPPRRRRWRSGSARPPTASTRVEAYGFDYGLDLFSNFTYFLDDPDNGDQFEQRDERVRDRRPRQPHAAGSRSSAGARMVTVGGDVRRDAIDAVGLYRTDRARAAVDTVREDAVGQTSGAALRRGADAVVGRRCARRSACAATSIAGTSRPAIRSTAAPPPTAIVNPKLSVAFGPWRRTELYASAGGGFHSNDGRGATIRRDPVSGDAVDAGRSAGPRARRRSGAAHAGPAAPAHDGRASGVCGSTPSCSSSATPARPRPAGRAAASASSGTPTTAPRRG